MALDIIPKQEGGKFKAVASGTLPSGKPVVVNADGTVSVVEGVAAGAGTPVVFESAATDNTHSVFDSNSNKIVIIYQDEGNSNYGTAVVGTVSGTSISFGTPVVYQSNNSNHDAVTFDSNANKVVVFYRNAGLARGAAVVGTVSGTSISFGSEVIVNGATDIRGPSATFDSNSNKVVLAYFDFDNLDYGTAIVGTVSGTTISFGTAVVFESADVGNISATFDSSNNKVVIAYDDNGNSSYGTAVVGTVSGTSISFGTPVVFESAITSFISATFDSTNNKVVIAYRDNGNSSYGTAIVGTVSGTSISFGDPTVFEVGTTFSISCVYDASVQKVIVAYGDVDDSQYGKVVVGTVSGTSITFESPTVFESAAVNNISTAYDSNSQKVVVSYSDGGNSDYGTSAVFTSPSTNLTSENYIGISSGGAVADTGNATVDIVGTVNKEQSGLTAGQKYYVQTDGTLSETADDPSVLAGTAISATKMVVKS